ncbi:MAG TPA: hypothetical protein PKH32_05380 [Verrucomicrobiota bacterium]|nr:hypothetical protein [Verrucomicrobiota bacterium]
MPGVRSKGQIMIGCWCEEALVAKIDKARGQQTRSQFCREALAEKLRRLGVDVAAEEIASPSSIGKGGPRVTYRLRRYQASLNEGKARPKKAGS